MKWKQRGRHNLFIVVCICFGYLSFGVVAELGHSAAWTSVFLLPFLNNPKILFRLKMKVTVYAVGQCKHATVITPHIENACLCENILRLCEDTLTTVKALTIQVKEALKDAFEEKAEENGQLTGERLKVILSEYQEKLLSVINEQISDLVRRIVPVPGKADDQ